MKCLFEKTTTRILTFTVLLHICVLIFASSHSWCITIPLQIYLYHHFLRQKSPHSCVIYGVSNCVQKLLDKRRLTIVAESFNNQNNQSLSVKDIIAICEGRLLDCYCTVFVIYYIIIKFNLALL